MNEHSFVRAVHRQLEDNIYHWKINDRYAGGVADAMYVGWSGEVLFIEYKYTKLPALASTVMRPNLTKLQLMWLADMHNRGLETRICIGAEGKGVLLHVNNREITTSDFIQHALTPKQLAQEISGIVNYDGNSRLQSRRVRVHSSTRREQASERRVVAERH